MLVAAKGCRASGGQAVLVGPQESVTQVLQMSGFDRLLKVFSDRDSALASFSTAS
ncbi:MAG: STAS domain-containing protein [Betaproteobacteria bacterium]|nr:STAS domain-containing protein [Betaproteobacteria bacterium]